MAKDAAAMVQKTKDYGVYSAVIDGEEITLTQDDLLIFVKNKEGFVAQSDYGVTVILETKLTPELIEEGYEREIISKVQNMRKDSGFEVTDHIKLGITGDEEIAAVVKNYGNDIAAVTLADEITAAADDAAVCDINGKSVKISVDKIC